MGETYSGCYIQSVEEIHEIMDSQIGSERVNIGLEETNKIADLCDVVQMPFQNQNYLIMSYQRVLKAIKNL